MQLLAFVVVLGAAQFLCQALPVEPCEGLAGQNLRAQFADFYQQVQRRHRETDHRFATTHGQAAFMGMSQVPPLDANPPVYTDPSFSSHLGPPVVDGSDPALADPMPAMFPTASNDGELVQCLMAYYAPAVLRDIPHYCAPWPDTTEPFLSSGSDGSERTPRGMDMLTPSPTLSLRKESSGLKARPNLFLDLTGLQPKGWPGPTSRR
ncbi:hypothetical protein IWQ60_002509 [Tieghemiomyces parasiticus]|uniref:Uncharacterized protein n=1 Tax=Tieghemiomyces parasiticus TaxID=78921 RepID=A0A9W8ACL5_9FUNG|nr:hypothetical protein IWQ60_002509 [Tieghemiomyces parasiticus]